MQILIRSFWTFLFVLALPFLCLSEVFSQEKPIQGECWMQPEGQMSRVLHILNGVSEEVTYMITGRGLKEVSALHGMSTESMVQEFQNQGILDLGAGHGNFVADLAEKGIEIKGLDIVKSKSWDQRPFLKDRFIHKNMMDTGEPDNHYDILISTFGIFWYYPASDAPSRYHAHPEVQRALFKASLQESLRILRPGGRLLISPLKENVKDLLVQMVKDLGGATVEFYRPEPDSSLLWALRIRKTQP